MASRITLQTPSISAGATISLMQQDTNANKLRSAISVRNLVAVGFAGATVNTGEIVGFVANEEVFRMPNGVTNSSGAPIKQDDVTSIDELIDSNENFDVQITNSSGGALQFYVYLEFEDLE